MQYTNYHKHKYMALYLHTYREKTSAESTLPMILPKWGTLFTYGKAEVMRILRLPSWGSIFAIVKTSQGAWQWQVRPTCKCVGTLPCFNLELDGNGMTQVGQRLGAARHGELEALVESLTIPKLNQDLSCPIWTHELWTRFPHKIPKLLLFKTSNSLLE